MPRSSAAVRPTSRRRRTVITIIVVAVLVVTVPTVVLLTRLAETRGAEHAALEYLEALAAGDAGRADELSTTALPADDANVAAIRMIAPDDPGFDTLLSDAGLEAATEHLSEPTVTGSTALDDGEVQVEGTYVLGGQVHDVLLTMLPERGGWTVGTPLVGHIRVVAPAQAPVTFGDSEVGAIEWTNGDTISVRFAYPGVYDVRGVDDTWFDATDGQAVVAPTSGVSGEAIVAVETSATPAVLEAVSLALDRAIASCTVALGDAQQPFDCPSERVVLGTPVTPPTVTTVDPAGGFRATGGVLELGFVGQGTSLGPVATELYGRYVIQGDQVVITEFDGSRL